MSRSLKNLKFQLVTPVAAAIERAKSELEKKETDFDKGPTEGIRKI
jgi:hypothetical protein